MIRNSALAAIILEALSESTDVQPLGHLYAAMMSVATLDQFEQIILTMESQGWVKVTSETIQITGSGRELVQQSRAEP